MAAMAMQYGMYRFFLATSTYIFQILFAFTQCENVAATDRKMNDFGQGKNFLLHLVHYWQSKDSLSQPINNQ